MPPLVSLCFGVGCARTVWGWGGRVQVGFATGIYAEIKAAERENKLIEIKEAEIMKQEPIFAMMSKRYPVRGTVREGDSQCLPLPAHFFPLCPSSLALFPLNLSVIQNVSLHKERKNEIFHETTVDLAGPFC